MPDPKPINLPAAKAVLLEYLRRAPCPQCGGRNCVRPAAGELTVEGVWLKLPARCRCKQGDGVYSLRNNAPTCWDNPTLHREAAGAGVSYGDYYLWRLSIYQRLVDAGFPGVNE